MLLFFILYWAAFLIGYWTVKSYGRYYRQNIRRHHYAERHRRTLERLQQRPQLKLFNEPSL